jgi:hypothetical protein
MASWLMLIGSSIYLVASIVPWQEFTDPHGATTVYRLLVGFSTQGTRVQIAQVLASLGPLILMFVAAIGGLRSKHPIPWLAVQVTVGGLVVFRLSGQLFGLGSPTLAVGWYLGILADVVQLTAAIVAIGELKGRIAADPPAATPPMPGGG